MKFQNLIIFLIMGIFVSKVQAISLRKEGVITAPDLEIEGRTCSGKKIITEKCIIKNQEPDRNFEGTCTTPKRDELFLLDRDLGIKGGAIGITIDLYSKMFGAEKKIQYCLKYRLDFIPDVQTLAGNKIFVRYPNISYPLSIKVEFFGENETKKAKIGEQLFNVRLGPEDEELFLAGKPSTKFGTETFILPQLSFDILTQYIVIEALPVEHAEDKTVQLPKPPGAK